MKRILLSIAILSIFSAGFFAETDSDGSEIDADTTFVYETNGKGDQYIRVGLFANFPLNFGNPFKTDASGRLSEGFLYVGGAAEIGYYRFLNRWLALGGDLIVAYNPTLGNNSLTMVPLTFGVAMQPSFNKFEFPAYLGLGLGFETCQNKKYFPSPVAKAELGAFYRITETWSVGLTGLFLYVPQWSEVDGKTVYDYGNFAMASVSARYHF